MPTLLVRMPPQQYPGELTPPDGSGDFTCGWLGGVDEGLG